MFILKIIYIIIRSAECPNFEVANPIKLALTSRETTLVVSVSVLEVEVEVKLNLPNVIYKAMVNATQNNILGSHFEFAYVTRPH